MLIKYKRSWTPLQKKTFIRTMIAGSKHYNIHPKVIMSIIEIESNYKIKAINKNKKSIDYGLSQINSENWDWLTEKSKKVLEEVDIKYTDSKYDIALNVMNSFSYFDWSKKTLEKKGLFTYPKLIKSYNVGVNGSLSKNKNYERIRKSYFEKFVISYNSHF
jgi:soluble lytic murein transglycosylase-like protein